MDIDMQQLAYVVAERAHAGQVRKGSHMPYITHPRAVAATLREHYPGNDDLFVAGLLHDVVEDTPLSIDTIGLLFGNRVAGLVWAVTNTRPNYTLVGASLDALRLKAADLLCNIGETQRDIEAGQFVWPRFASGRGKVASWERQTSAIEDALASDDKKSLDRTLLKKLRGRVDVMKGLVNIVTDAEREALP